MKINRKIKREKNQLKLFDPMKVHTHDGNNTVIYMLIAHYKSLPNTVLYLIHEKKHNSFTVLAFNFFLLFIYY